MPPPAFLPGSDYPAALNGDTRRPNHGAVLRGQNFEIQANIRGKRHSHQNGKSNHTPAAAPRKCRAKSVQSHDEDRFAHTPMREYCPKSRQIPTIAQSPEVPAHARYHPPNPMWYSPQYTRKATNGLLRAGQSTRFGNAQDRKSRDAVDCNHLLGHHAGKSPVYLAGCLKLHNKSDGLAKQPNDRIDKVLEFGT